MTVMKATGTEALTRMNSGRRTGQLQNLQKQLKNGASLSAFDRERLEEACRNLESLFVNQMMKSMRRNMPAGGIFEKNNAEKIFEDMLYQEYAGKMVSGQTNGLAKQMYEQLTRSL